MDAAKDRHGVLTDIIVQLSDLWWTGEDLTWLLVDVINFYENGNTVTAGTAWSGRPNPPTKVEAARALLQLVH